MGLVESKGEKSTKKHKFFVTNPLVKNRSFRNESFSLESSDEDNLVISTDTTVPVLPPDDSFKLSPVKKKVYRPKALSDRSMDRFVPDTAPPGYSFIGVKGLAGESHYPPPIRKRDPTTEVHTPRSAFSLHDTLTMSKTQAHHSWSSQARRRSLPSIKLLESYPTKSGSVNSVPPGIEICSNSSTSIPILQPPFCVHPTDFDTCDDQCDEEPVASMSFTDLYKINLSLEGSEDGHPPLFQLYSLIEYLNTIDLTDMDSKSVDITELNKFIDHLMRMISPPENNELKTIALKLVEKFIYYEPTLQGLIERGLVTTVLRDMSTEEPLEDPYLCTATIVHDLLSLSAESRTVIANDPLLISNVIWLLDHTEHPMIPIQLLFTLAVTQPRPPYLKLTAIFLCFCRVMSSYAADQAYSKEVAIVAMCGLGKFLGSFKVLRNDFLTSDLDYLDSLLKLAMSELSDVQQTSVKVLGILCLNGQDPECGDIIMTVIRRKGLDTVCAALFYPANEEVVNECCWTLGNMLMIRSAVERALTSRRLIPTLVSISTDSKYRGATRAEARIAIMHLFMDQNIMDFPNFMAMGAGDVLWKSLEAMSSDSSDSQCVPILSSLIRIARASPHLLIDHTLINGSKLKTSVEDLMSSRNVMISSKATQLFALLYSAQ